MVILTTLCGVPPAARTTASTLSSAWANCAAKSWLANSCFAFQPTWPAT